MSNSSPLSQRAGKAENQYVGMNEDGPGEMILCRMTLKRAYANA